MYSVINQCCRTSCCAFFHSGDPTRLYPLYCTLYFCTLTRRQLHALVALSSAFVSDIFSIQFYSVWTPAYAPGEGQTSRVYSSNPVLHLYISCYVTVNKPVLSNLSLRLLPQWWPRSGCTLCTVHCTSVHSLTCRQPHALVALSPAFLSDIFVQLLRCTLNWLQLNKRFLLSISLRNQQTFFTLILSVGSWP